MIHLTPESERLILLVLLVVNLFTTATLAVMSWRAYAFVTWVKGVMLPWVVKVGNLLDDDYNHPSPPLPPPDPPAT